MKRGIVTLRSVCEPGDIYDVKFIGRSFFDHDCSVHQATRTKVASQVASQVLFQTTTTIHIQITSDQMRFQN